MENKPQLMSSWSSAGVFHEDILYQILLPLPVASLIKCSAVCKWWNFVIKSSAFIDTHLRRQRRHLLLMKQNSNNNFNTYYDAAASSDEYTELMIPPPLSPWNNNFNLYYDAAASSDEYTELIIPPPLSPWKMCLTVAGACNGLICLAPTSPHVPTVIWNPSIRKYVILPRPNFVAALPAHHKLSHHFVYDSRTADYKVLRIFWDYHISTKTPVAASTVASVQIFSLATGLWTTAAASTAASATAHCPLPAKVCQEQRSSCGSEGAVFVNDTRHWVQQDKRIASFNLVTQLFGQAILPPEEASRRKSWSSDLLRYEDSLALVVETGYNWCTCGLKVWVMKEYGVEDSWIKVFDSKVKLLQGFYLHRRALGFKNRDELVLALDRFEDDAKKLTITTVSLNLKTKQVQSVGINDDFYPGAMDELFVESLALLDHPFARTYQLSSRP